jgi:hypothetical protein
MQALATGKKQSSFELLLKAPRTVTAFFKVKTSWNRTPLAYKICTQRNTIG